MITIGQRTHYNALEKKEPLSEKRFSISAHSEAKPHVIRALIFHTIQRCHINLKIPHLVAFITRTKSQQSHKTYHKKINISFKRIPPKTSTIPAMTPNCTNPSSLQLSICSCLQNTTHKKRTTHSFNPKNHPQQKESPTILKRQQREIFSSNIAISSRLFILNVFVYFNGNIIPQNNFLSLPVFPFRSLNPFTGLEIKLEQKNRVSGAYF